MRSGVIRTSCLGLALILILSACGMEQQAAGSNNLNYKEVKTMVVDILKTKEGKKAIEEAQSTSSEGSSGGGMKAQSLTIQQEEQVRTAVKETITSDEYKMVLEKVMMDPKFAADFAKAISQDNKKLHQELIKDPTYQKSVSDIMKSPEVMNSYLDVMKSPEYRTQLLALIKDALNSPLYKIQIMELLSKVVQEELKPKEQEQKKSENKGNSNSQEGGSDKEKSGGEGKEQG